MNQKHDSEHKLFIFTYNIIYSFHLKIHFCHNIINIFISIVRLYKNTILSIFNVFYSNIDK